MRDEPVLLGDPHLGKRFTKGIPIERRGEREQLVRDDFVRRLDPQGASVHICMGDLFDKPQVDYATLLFAAQSYMAAAFANPRTSFYILQGNHDDSRDLDEVTAWDVFGQMMRGVQNAHCVVEPRHFGTTLLMPWHPTETVVEMLERIGPMVREFGLTAVYGHWDTDPRSASHNLIPTRELAALGITTAYTGHVHKPDSFRRDGVDVVVVGSMQAYSQGEDGGQGHIRYATLMADDPRLYEPGALADTCVRVQLRPGEQWEGEIPVCQSWDMQRLRPEEPVEAPADISMEGFDTRRAISGALDEHDIIPDVRSQIDGRCAETFGHG